MDRETLLDILTFVVKEYVVEGPPPMLVHQAETLADLQGAVVRAADQRAADAVRSSRARDVRRRWRAGQRARRRRRCSRCSPARQPLGQRRRRSCRVPPRACASSRPRCSSVRRSRRRPVVDTRRPHRRHRQQAAAPTRGVAVRGRPEGERPRCRRRAAAAARSAQPRRAGAASAAGQPQPGARRE